MTPSELRVRKVSHRGAIAEWKLNPVWVRLDRQTHPEFGIERLFLISRGRRLPIAGFLGPREKEAFAMAFSAALALDHLVIHLSGRRIIGAGHTDIEKTLIMSQI